MPDMFLKIYFWSFSGMFSRKAGDQLSHHMFRPAQSSLWHFIWYFVCHAEAKTNQKSWILSVEFDMYIIHVQGGILWSAQEIFGILNDVIFSNQFYNMHVSVFVHLLFEMCNFFFFVWGDVLQHPNDKYFFGVCLLVCVAHFLKWRLRNTLLYC